MMELHLTKSVSECINFLIVMQELVLYTEQKISTHKRISESKMFVKENTDKKNGLTLLLTKKT